jgi:hypothetical protein
VQKRRGAFFFGNGGEMMRFVLALALTAAGGVFAGGPATAQVAKSYQFCSKESPSGTECIYDNIAQCMENARGNGGWCKTGPAYDPKHPLGTGEFPQAPNW